MKIFSTRHVWRINIGPVCSREKTLLWYQGMIMLILFLLSLQIERYISFLLSEHFVCFHYSETSVVVNSILKHITRVYDIMEEGVLMVETREAIYCCLVPTTCSSLAQNTEHWPPIARQWTPHPSCNRT